LDKIGIYYILFLSCQKHISLKNEKEVKLTALGSARNQPEEEKRLFEDEEKAV